MAIITASLVMAFKGAIFLSKSAAVKGAIMKYGAYVVSTHGVAATASAGLTVATAAGYFVTIKSIPKNAMNGFTQVTNGLSKGSPADFMDGLYKLSRAYVSADSLISDFIKLVDASDCNFDIKISLKESIKGLKPLIENEIEHKSYALLKEIEDSLARCGMSTDNYSKKIKSIYFNHTFDLRDDYTELLGRGGRIYSDIRNLNNSLSMGSYNEYDHYLVYCIAGWMKDNLQLSCLDYKGQEKIAGDITDQIFAYLKAYRLG
jgi:hypothetical protein